MAHPPIDQQVTWFYCEDTEATARFYGETIGLERVFDEQGGEACVFRAGRNAFLGICRAFDDRKIEPSGAMFTFVTDQVDEWYEHLAAKGVRMRGKPELLEAFNIYTLFALDPNGYMLEFQTFLDPAWPKPE